MAQMPVADADQQVIVDNGKDHSCTQDAKSPCHRSSTYRGSHTDYVRDHQGPYRARRNRGFISGILPLSRGQVMLMHVEFVVVKFLR